MSKPMEGGPLYFKDRKVWRAWLAKHHEQPSGIWMKFFKKGSAERSVSYEDAVQEAICFGWIDSVVRRGDDQYYIQWFSPRRRGSVWSEKNIERAKMMIAEGLMTEAGRRVLPDPLEATPPRPGQELVMNYDQPKELRSALAKDKVAFDFYESLPPSHRKRFHMWINMAKRPETRARRIEETIRSLRAGERMGLK